MVGLYRVDGARRNKLNKLGSNTYDTLSLTPIAGGRMKLKAVAKADTIYQGDIVEVIGNHPSLTGYKIVKKRSGNKKIAGAGRR